MLQVKHIAAIFFVVVTLAAQAQTYPFAEGFEGLPSGQVPAGWGGSMKVLLAHGRNDSKGLVAKLSSTIMADSTITPLVGPLNSTSVISFYYRIIDQNIYPSTPTTLGDGDTIDFYISTDNTNYTHLHSINQSNHTSSFNFVRRQIYLGTYAGSNATVKIKCRFGSGGGYFVDFDTITYRNDPQAGIDDMAQNSLFSVYPNPCNTINGCNVALPYVQPATISVYNALGDLVYQQQQFTGGRLPADNWQPGLYFVQMGNLTRKLVIE